MSRPNERVEPLALGDETLFWGDAVSPFCDLPDWWDTMETFDGAEEVRAVFPRPGDRRLLIHVYPAHAAHIVDGASAVFEAQLPDATAHAVASDTLYLVATDGGLWKVPLESSPKQQVPR